MKEREKEKEKEKKTEREREQTKCKEIDEVADEKRDEKKDEERDEERDLESDKKREVYTKEQRKIKKDIMDRNKTKIDLSMYCKLIRKKVKRISEDEVLTAKTFENIISKWNMKKAKIYKVPPNQSCSPNSSHFFNNYYIKQEPIIIKNLGDQIGDCIHNFSNKNIIDNIGHTKVSIHVSNTKFLNNVDKNFQYKLSSIKDFICFISEEEQKRNTFTVSEKSGKLCILLKRKNEESEKNKESSNEALNENVKESVKETIKESVKGNVKESDMSVEESDKVKEKISRVDTGHYEKIQNEKQYIDKEYNALETKKKSEINQDNVTSDETERKYYYYRSLGKNQFKEVSDVKKMNTYIKDNFYLPKSLYPCFTKYEFFSSVLRIGQNNLFIWLHYDTPDNFLIQIKGRKKVLLIPPQFIKYFNIIGSSSSYNLFHILTRRNLTKNEKVIKKILIKHSIVADLFEGDILFIPSLWLHYIYNMPEHTFVCKKFKQLHQHMYVKREKEKEKNAEKNEGGPGYYWNGKEKENIEGEQLQKKNKKENGNSTPVKNSANKQTQEENANTFIYFYKNEKFKQAVKQKWVKHFFIKAKKKRRTRMRAFINSDSMHEKEKEENKEVSNCHNIYICDQEENMWINKNNFVEEELIKHYSHMENYEQFLKDTFNTTVSVPESVSTLTPTSPPSSSRLKRNGEETSKENSREKEDRQNTWNKVKDINPPFVNKCNNKCNSTHNNINDSVHYVDYVDADGSCDSADTHLQTKLNISINFFFRKRKETKLFSKKDLYGNQDATIVNQTLQQIKKVVKPVLELPNKYKNFYLQKIQGILYAHIDDDKYLY